MTTTPLRRVLKPRDDSNRSELTVLSVYRDHGVVPKESRSDNFNKTPEDVSRYLHVREGDLVVNKMKAWSGSVAVSAHEGIVSADYLVCSVAPSVEPRFLHHLLRSKSVIGEMSIRSIGIRPNQERLYWDDLAEIAVPLPDISEQRRIADFLDDRVARIDQIVKARHQQIGLAETEFRSALESEIWRDRDRMPLKHLLDSVTSGPRGWGDLVRDEGTPFVRIGNLRPLGIELLTENLARVDMPSDAESHRASLTDGDVLLSITAAFGEVAVWRRGDGTFSQHVARLRPLDPDDADWIAWVLQTVSAHDQYRLSAYGGTKIGLGLDQVRNLEVPRTDPDMRLRVSASVNREWATFAARQSALARSTELMLEYKQSLITAAVTGAIDVTTASSGIPG